ncbi:MAG: DUF503 domain-containing protein [bacterium]|nr:DUF503 domain-containing protein [Gemmatimonadota bacterium]
MRVATLEVDFRIPGSDSLKAKRKIVKSLKERIRHRFPVAIAETGSQDLHARAELGIAAVAGNGALVERILDEIERYLESDPRILIVEAVRDRW